MEMTETTTFADLLCTRRGIVGLMSELGLQPDAWLGRTVLEGTAQAGVDASEIYDRVEELPSRNGIPKQWRETARRNALTLERALGESLPLTLALASKVASVHGPKDPELATLQQVVEELSEAAVEHLEGDAAHASSRRSQLEALLARVRTLADGYRTPTWACRTMTRYYEALAQLDGDLSDQLAIETLSES